MSAATAWTDYSVPTGTETLTNKTLTSPTENYPTINYPHLNVWSDANGDMYYRDTGVLARIPIGSTNDTLNIVWGVPTWSNPFTYTWTYVFDSISVSWAWNSDLSTSRQMVNTTIGNVALTGSAGSAYIEYSANGSSWTTIITTWASQSFPLILKKWYYYRVRVTATVNWPTSTASINYIL